MIQPVRVHRSDLCLFPHSIPSVRTPPPRRYSISRDQSSCDRHRLDMTVFQYQKERGVIEALARRRLERISSADNRADGRHSLDDRIDFRADVNELLMWPARNILTSGTGSDVRGLMIWLFCKYVVDDAVSRHISSFLRWWWNEKNYPLRPTAQPNVYENVRGDKPIGIPISIPSGSYRLQLYLLFFSYHSPHIPLSPIQYGKRTTFEPPWPYEDAEWGTEKSEVWGFRTNNSYIYANEYQNSEKYERE